MLKVGQWWDKLLFYKKYRVSNLVNYLIILARLGGFEPPTDGLEDLVSDTQDKFSMAPAYLIITRNPAMMSRTRMTGTRQPMSAPILRCRPDLVRGMPIFRLSLVFAAEMPKARFQEKPPLFIGLFPEILNVGAKGLV